MILVHDSERQSTTLEILSRPREQGGKRYCMAGVNGPGAGEYFEKMDYYYFGYPPTGIPLTNK